MMCQYVILVPKVGISSPVHPARRCLAKDDLLAKDEGSLPLYERDSARLLLFCL